MAGFGHVEAFADYISYGTPDRVRAFASDRAAECRDRELHASVTRYGIASAEELLDLAAAWDKWGDDPTAFFAFAWCRVLAWYRNTQGQTKGSGDSATLHLYQLRPDQIYMTGRLGLRLRPNQSIGANRRGGPSSDHPAALQRAARPRKSLCSDITAPVQAVLTKHDGGSGRVAGHVRIR